MFPNIIKSKLQLIERNVLNHDCLFCKFKWAGPQIPLKIGNSLYFQMFLKTHDHPEGQLVKRKYTPISLSSQTDILEFIFKIYRANQHPNFPHGGKMTPYIEKLKVGDIVDVEGPLGKFTYRKGFMKFPKGQEQFPVKKLVLVAGGSGIAPFFNIVKEINADKTDDLELVLLFANKSEADIILKDQLQQLGERVKVHYIIDKASSEEWKGHTGYVTKEILEKISALDEKTTLYGSCGPYLMNELVRSIISEFPESRYYKF